MSKAAIIRIEYYEAHSKKNTVRSYQAGIDRFRQDFGESEIDQIAPDEVLSFLSLIFLIKVL